jgi:lipopolysaccharide transport system ATP-binding protein
MSDAVIRVEGLGKKYVLSHNSEEYGRYRSLREVVTNGVRSMLRRSPQVRTNSEAFWALRDVNFEINQGDRVGIIGRNGAGKSTLLKLLSRIVEPTTGRIGIRGRVASLLEVGTGFHPELTGRENIFLNGAILGMSRREIDRKFDEIVAFAEVEKFLDTPVKRYSSGMYVRLAFAVAAHLEPEILIVDEVLAVGDAQFQKKCLGKMEDVSGEGRTVIFVSHQMGMMTQLCNQGIYLKQGAVVCQGTMNDVVMQYVNSGSNDHGIVEFAPKTNGSAIEFNQISITSADASEPTGELDIRYPFAIHLDYTVYQTVKNVEMSVRLSSTDGRPILTTAQSDCSPEKLGGGVRLPGTYRASIHIPAMFLMPGSYMLTIAAHEPSVKLFDMHENVISFNILETGTKLSKYSDLQSMGVILKDFQWDDAIYDNPKSLVNSLC